MKRLIFILMLASFSNSISAQITYTFIGNGKWSDSANWLNKVVPPDIFKLNSIIIITPLDSGECIVDIPMFIPKGVNFSVQRGKRMRIIDDFKIENYLDSFRLTSDDIDFLDSISVQNPSSIILSKIVSSSQIGEPQKIYSVKDKFIDSLKKYAYDWSAQKQNGGTPILHPAGILPNEPSHYGLAYRFGGLNDDKDITLRLNPTEGDNTHKTDAVFGTDCTGFLINLLRKAGLKMDFAVSNNFDIILSKMLQSQKNINYNNIRLDSIGYLASTDLKNGDFIIWREKGHDGIIFIDVNNQKRYLYNSNGNPYPESPPFCKGCNDKECDQSKNRGNSRGVHPIKFTDAIDVNSGYWGSHYIIFRLENVDISSNPLTSITINSAISGGSINYNGNNQVAAKGMCWSKNSPPTVLDSITNEGINVSGFTSNLSKLEINSTYHIRAYVTIKSSATDKGVNYYGNEIVYKTVQNHTDTFVDSRDQQPYPYKQIGSQIWMTKNLNYDAPGSWSYNDNPTNSNTYGRLYDWSTATGGCPTGWHLPSYNEWSTLLDYLNGAGGFLKDTINWSPPNVGANNLTGFSALPGGFKYALNSGGAYTDLGVLATFWSSTAHFSYDSYVFALGTNIEYFINGANIIGTGSSVRCMKN